MDGISESPTVNGISEGPTVNGIPAGSTVDGIPAGPTAGGIPAGSTVDGISAEFFMTTLMSTAARSVTCAVHGVSVLHLISKSTC